MLQLPPVLSTCTRTVHKVLVLYVYFITESTVVTVVGKKSVGPPYFCQCQTNPPRPPAGYSTSRLPVRVQYEYKYKYYSTSTSTSTSSGDGKLTVP